MAYNIIKTKNLNPSNNKFIDALKYAILEKNGKYYLQLKLKNISKYAITKFKIIYLDDGYEKEYEVSSLDIKPETIFFEKTLIELDSTDFELIDFIDIKGKKVIEVEENNENKKFISKEKNKNNTEKLKSFHLIRILAFILIFFSIIPTIYIFININDCFSLASKQSLWLYIINLLMFVSGITLLVFSIIKSYIAKQNGEYDSSYNVKSIVHLLPICMIICIISTIFGTMIDYENIANKAPVGGVQTPATDATTSIDNSLENEPNTPELITTDYSQELKTHMADEYGFVLPFIECEDYYVRNYAPSLYLEFEGVYSLSSFINEMYDNYNIELHKSDFNCDTYSFDVFFVSIYGRLHMISVYQNYLDNSAFVCLEMESDFIADYDVLKYMLSDHNIPECLDNEVVFYNDFLVFETLIIICENEESYISKFNYIWDSSESVFGEGVTGEVRMIEDYYLFYLSDYSYDENYVLAINYVHKDNIDALGLLDLYPYI